MNQQFRSDRGLKNQVGEAADKSKRMVMRRSVSVVPSGSGRKSRFRSRTSRTESSKARMPEGLINLKAETRPLRWTVISAYTSP